MSYGINNECKNVNLQKRVRSFLMAGGKRVGPQWRLLLCVLAHRHQSASNLELMVEARRICVKHNIKYNKLDGRKPETFKILGKISKSDIYVCNKECKIIGEEIYKYAGTVRRDPCYIRRVSNKAYNLIGWRPKKKSCFKCRRCGDFVHNKVLYVARHKVMCAQAGQHKYRNGTLGKKRVKAPQISFKRLTYRAPHTILDKLRQLGIYIGNEFSSNNNRAVFDIEAYSTKMETHDKKGFPYTPNLTFGTLQCGAVICLSYKICDRPLAKTRLFYKADSQQFVQRFVDFLLKIAQKNSEYLMRVKYVNYFAQLETIERRQSSRNIVLSRRASSVKRALIHYCKQYTIMGYNSGLVNLKIF